MKHNRTKIYLTFGILLFGIFSLLISCEKDTFAETQKNVDSEPQLTPTIKTLSNENTGQVFDKLKNHLQLDPYLKIKQETNELAKTTQNSNGITIYTDQIKEITFGNYTSYTMLIETPNSDDSKFYNFTIEDKNGESSMFVTKYEPTENWLSNTSIAFEGNITARGVTKLEELGEEEETPDSNGNGYNGGGGGSPQGSPYYPTDCDGRVIVTYETITVCTCAGHLPGQCNGCSSWEDIDIPYYYCEPYEDGYNSDSDYPNNDDSNNDGGGNSNGNSSGSNTGPNSITVLLGPGEECENPPTGDLNRDCQLDDYEACLLNGNSQEICDCVALGNDLSTCQEDIKCERLNRLVQNDSIGSNILPIVNQLRTKLGANDNEWSISYKNKWVDGTRKNVPDDNGIQEGTSNTRSKFSYGTTWVGQIHTHPEETYSVFSWLDLRALMLIDTESHNDFNNEIFIMAVAPKNITYALKVDNIQTLIDKINEDIQNAVGSNDDKKRENLMKEMKKKYDESTNLEQTFLSLFGNYGISLYEATDSNLSNWKKLELDENDNETVNETPCN